MQRSNTDSRPCSICRLRFHALLLLTVLVTATSAFATAWVSRHNLTATEYQNEFNKWSDDPYNYRLISVCGYEKGGQARYAAVWADQSGPAWVTHAGLSYTAYAATNTLYASQGFHPVFLSAFGVGNQVFYNAIWEYSPKADVVTEIGLPYHDYVALNSVHVSQGYKLVQLWTCNAGSGEYFSGIWRKGDSANYTVRVRRTSSEYQNEFNSLAAKGNQLITVSAAVVNGQSLFTSVWKSPGNGVAWASHHDLSEMNYQGQTWNWQYQGYRPVFTSAFNPDGGERFNVIFQRNGGMTAANLATVNNAINSYMQSNNVPGLSLAISRNGELVYAKGFGLADQSANEWTHPFHRFRIASVSKPVTAVAVMKLRDCCGLELDQQVFGSGGILGNSYGTPSALEEDIQVRHLLEHTTGWDDETDGDGIWNVGGSDPDPAITWQIQNTDPVDNPGDTFNYMNTDYVTLGRVIERISGRSYEQFVREEVLAPSCVTEMEIGSESLAERLPNEVVYYANGDNPYGLSPHRMDGNGGWIAKPMDLLLFLRRFDGDPAHAQILSAGSLTAMRTGSTASGGGYGLGLNLGTDGWGHNGCMPGTIAFMEHRNDGFAFAVTCNIRPTNDSCAWGLKAVINGIIDALNTANAWPAYDLFPCEIPPGDPPQTMEVTDDIYVDGSCNSALPNGQQNCTFFLGPYKTVNQGVNSVCAGDRLWIRVGSYDETVRFDRRVTVRSYDGTAVVGK